MQVFPFHFMTVEVVANHMVCWAIDYIYTYLGLHTGLVNTNQHLHSMLYLYIHISVTLLCTSFEKAISGSELHHIVTEENSIYYIQLKYTSYIFHNSCSVYTESGVNDKTTENVLVKALS